MKTERNNKPFEFGVYFFRIIAQVSAGTFYFFLRLVISFFFFFLLLLFFIWKCFFLTRSPAAGGLSVDEGDRGKGGEEGHFWKRVMMVDVGGVGEGGGVKDEMVGKRVGRGGVVEVNQKTWGKESLTKNEILKDRISPLHIFSLFDVTC